MKTIEKKLTELNPAEYNPRKISDKQLSDLTKSIEEFGITEPLVINTYEGRENTVISGHQRLKALKKLKYKTVPCVEVSLDKKRERELNVRMNKNTGEFDFDLLEEFFEVEELIGWGFDEDELNFEILEEDQKYTSKVDTPIYEPKNEKPNISELCDKEKTEKLIKEINNSDISKKEKMFLINAANRHSVFNYEKIADYYAHSNKEIQQLMECSALVIIDFEKAIEYGYVTLSDEIKEQYKEDYGE